MTPPRSAASVRCLYDWKADRPDVLACTAHSASGGHSIMRMPSLGHDILLELYAHGMLAGRALEDAKNLHDTLDPGI